MLAAGQIAGLYSKHVPIVPVLPVVDSWSGQVNFGPW